MKAIYKRTMFFIGFLSIVLPMSAVAAEYRAGEEASLNFGETLYGNTYMGGGTVTDAGTVRGDLVAAGGTILITGPIGSDLLAAGGTITVTGDISGDARIGGGNLLISGKVSGDVMIGGGQVVLSSPQIGGDVTVAGGSVTIAAPIAGNVRVAGGQLTINSPIKGSVTVHAQKITLGPKAVITGDLIYSSSEVATIQDGAQVLGKTQFTKIENPNGNKISATALAAIFTFAFVAKLLMQLLAAFVFFWIFPKYAKEIAANFNDKPLENLGRGFVAFVVAPIGALILLFTVIGIPLGLLTFIGFIGLVLFSVLIAPIAIGSLVQKWFMKSANFEVSWVTIVLGVAIYTLLSLVPFIGWIIQFVTVLMTMGIVIQVKWLAAKNWR